MRIFLTGFMGSGKTSFGKKLAKHLMFDFYDLDNEVEKQESLSVSTIFNQNGEEYFRQIERDCLKQIITKNNFVLATGGGTPYYFNNMDLINKAGLSIYLYMNSKAILNRLQNSKSERPLIKGMQSKELELFINEKLSLREQYYNRSHIKLNSIGISTEMAIKAIQNIIPNFYK